MPRALALLLLAAPLPALAGGQTYAGHRIVAADAGTGTQLAQDWLVGPDGGTHVTELTARWASEDVHLAIGVPFATHRVPSGRAIALGNLQLAGYYDLPTLPGASLGLEIHATIGEQAYSWVNSADELWPGAGARVVFQGHVDGEALTWLYRASLGFAGARGVAPFPDSYVTFEAAGGVDLAVGERSGVIGELALAWWDTSPLDAALLGRVDLTDALRLRGGVVLPIGTWANLDPAENPAGVREATITADLGLLF